MRESAKKDPDEAGRSLPQGLRARKRANGMLCRQNRSKSTRKAGCGLQLGLLRPNPAEISEKEARAGRAANRPGVRRWRARRAKHDIMAADIFLRRNAVEWVHDGG
jgi:hypothetical protein